MFERIVSMMSLDGRVVASLPGGGSGGDRRGAAQACVETYGAEVLGYLVRALGNEDDASEAFSQACEDLWLHFDRFEGSCSVRTWFYTLARHAACRLLRAPRRTHRHLDESVLADRVEAVRSSTLPYLRTTLRDGIRAIRDTLSMEDRTLLVLRVDRGMSWAEVARVFGGIDADPATLAALQVRLRKRFQLVKEQIRRRAEEARLVPTE